MLCTMLGNIYTNWEKHWSDTSFMNDVVVCVGITGHSQNSVFIPSIIMHLCFMIIYPLTSCQFLEGIVLGDNLIRFVPTFLSIVIFWFKVICELYSFKLLSVHSRSHSLSRSLWINSAGSSIQTTKATLLNSFRFPSSCLRLLVHGLISDQNWRNVHIYLIFTCYMWYHDSSKTTSSITVISL